MSLTMAAIEAGSTGAHVARSPGAQIMLPGQTPQGEHILAVLLKRSYEIVPGGRCRRAAKDRRLVAGDSHFADPMNSTVRAESDFVPYKLATDVVFEANAHAPDAVAVSELLVSVAIGDVVRSLIVIGDRQARHRVGGEPVFTEPAPFTTMPIRYERAFGGVDVASDLKVACIYPRNHLGRGFAIRNAPEVVDKLPLPNIEDPNDRLSPARLCCGHFIHLEQLPEPAGFGWTMKVWRPRALMAGIMPADAALARKLRQAYRGLVPADQLALYDQTKIQPMDFRFFNGASRGLVLPYLRGDELVRTKHLTPSGLLEFRLPGEQPRIAIDIGGGSKTPEVRLQTVMIRLEDGEADLVWRAAIPFPGPDWLPAMRRLSIEID